MPYVALVLFGLWFHDRFWIFLFAGVSTALTIAGFLLSPEGGIMWMVLTNRFLALFAIWVTTLLLYFKAGTENSLRALEITSTIARAVSSELKPEEHLAVRGN